MACGWLVGGSRLASSWPIPPTRLPDHPAAPTGAPREPRRSTLVSQRGYYGEAPGGLRVSYCLSRLDACPAARKIRWHEHDTPGVSRFLCRHTGSRAVPPQRDGRRRFCRPWPQSRCASSSLGARAFSDPLAPIRPSPAAIRSLTLTAAAPRNGAAPPAAHRSSLPASSSSTATATRTRPRTTAGTKARPTPRRTPTVPKAFPSSKGRSGMR